MSSSSGIASSQVSESEEGEDDKKGKRELEYESAIQRLPGWVTRARCRARMWRGWMGMGLSGLRGEGGREDTKASGYGTETKMFSAQAMESEQDFSTIRKYEAGLQTESMEWSERRSAVSQCMNCLGAIFEVLVWEGNLEGEGI
jgi:hypothetical protein